MNTQFFLARSLPYQLRELATLALDLRWSWNHSADALWETVDPDLWKATGNPWLIISSISQGRLDQLAGDSGFLAELERQLAARDQYFAEPTWFEQVGNSSMGTVAYFSMEFGLAESLPIYSGGLGILAGDYLKTASDLGVPMVGVGLFYHRGYFRQVLDANGYQLAFYPYNDAHTLPLLPMREEGGQPLRISLDLPGRTLSLQVWAVQVGRVFLYLLDSNDPMNPPTDRAITGELYSGSSELRLQQEIVLGVGGWRLLEKLKIDCKICHMNEGHAAFAALERARSYMRRTGQNFDVALASTRAGNVFTTHTPIAAAFDQFSPDLLRRYGRGYADEVGVDQEQLLGMGRRNPHDSSEPFNMAFLAMRTSNHVNAVSRLHEQTSRRLFQPLFPGWPHSEIPIEYVTNGVHVPTWDSAGADALWTETCGKRRWVGTLETLEQDLSCATDDALWSLRLSGRSALVRRVRERIARQKAARGDPMARGLASNSHALDENTLTLCVARRFTGYKRPALLLHDRQRLTRILMNPDRPVQLIVAGKAHPQDSDGLRMIREWAQYTSDPEVRSRAVFLEDYDMAMAAELVQGVDLWINTPRRPWEACGTSGMKVLVNGGLNLSELDGWWAEAYSPEVGWALGDGHQHNEPEWDAFEASALYSLLEQEVVPAFYARNASGIPTAWISKIRSSMSRLTARFSTNRMLREYTERFYLQGAPEFDRRTADESKAAQGMVQWIRDTESRWNTLRFGRLDIEQNDFGQIIELEVHLGELNRDDVSIELYAESNNARKVVPMEAVREPAGATHGILFRAQIDRVRPASDYTPRAVPRRSGLVVPLEVPQIHWFSNANNSGEPHSQP